MQPTACTPRSGVASRAARCRAAARTPLRPAAPAAPLRARAVVRVSRSAQRHGARCNAAGSLYSLADAVTVDSLAALLSTQTGQLAAAAVAIVSVVGLAAAANAGGGSGAQASSSVSAASSAASASKVTNAVLVFGAGGRLGREVVMAILADGRTVVAAARDAAKTQATLEAALAASPAGAMAAKRLFVRGGVDVTDASTLTADLFKGVTQVVSATGAVFGKNAAGQMGYIDNMTSERVDALGNVNVAAAAAAHLPRPDADAAAGKAAPPVVTFDSEAAVAKWRRMDDVIMGGNSSSAWSLSPTAEEGGVPHGVWSGQLVLEGGGFCGCRADGLGLDLSGFDGLALRVRGDGQRYKLNLKTAVNDGISESTYQAVLDTRGLADGNWATVRIGWHEFVGVTRQVEDASVPPVDASTIRSLGFVLSRFEFNGLPNYAFRPGPFKLEVASIAPCAAPRPALVLLSSAGVERNARIGDDPVARKLDIPIVQLNPGGVLKCVTVRRLRVVALAAVADAKHATFSPCAPAGSTAVRARSASPRAACRTQSCAPRAWTRARTRPRRWSWGKATCSQAKCLALRLRSSRQRCSARPRLPAAPSSCAAARRPSTRARCPASAMCRAPCCGSCPMQGAPPPASARCPRRATRPRR
jgi:hypothetical protein